MVLRVAHGNVAHGVIASATQPFARSQQTIGRQEEEELQQLDPACTGSGCLVEKPAEEEAKETARQ
jgi:hypothetical protein